MQESGCKRAISGVVVEPEPNGYGDISRVLGTGGLRKGPAGLAPSSRPASRVVAVHPTDLEASKPEVLTYETRLQQ